VARHEGLNTFRLVGYSSTTIWAEAQPYAKCEFGKVMEGLPVTQELSTF
jgi:hypothetical protein